jgi:hypothetical protein
MQQNRNWATRLYLKFRRALLCRLLRAEYKTLVIAERHIEDTAYTRVGGKEDPLDESSVLVRIQKGQFYCKDLERLLENRSSIQSPGTFRLVKPENP